MIAIQIDSPVQIANQICRLDTEGKILETYDISFLALKLVSQIRKSTHKNDII